MASKQTTPPGFWGDMPEWTKDGEFPPVERTIPIYGTDPESGVRKLWVCRAVWQPVTASEIKMALYGPFGRRMATGESVFDALQKIRITLEDKEEHGEPWLVMTRGCRKDVYHVGRIVSRFPGDRAEILTPGQPVTESVDVLEELEPVNEVKLYGTTMQQMANFLKFGRSLDPNFAQEVTL